MKKILRTRWTRPMAEEQRRLARLRRALTDRLVLLAVSRGRVHVKSPPREIRDATPDRDRSTWHAAAYNAARAARVQPAYAHEAITSEVAR